MNAPPSGFGVTSLLAASNMVPLLPVDDTPTLKSARAHKATIKLSLVCKNNVPSSGVLGPFYNRTSNMQQLSYEKSKS